MPAVATFLGTKIATGILAGFTYGSIVKGAFLAAGLVASRRAAKKARSAYNASQRDRKITFRASDAPVSYVYGEAVTSGLLDYVVSYGQYGEKMTMVIVLGYHESDAITDIYLNNESIGALDANGWVTGGKWKPTSVRSKTYRIDSAQQTTYTLDPPPVRIDSVAFSLDFGGPDGIENRPLTEGTEWRATDNGIELLGTRANNRPVIVTYAYEGGEPLIRVKKFLGTAAGERDEDLEAASLESAIYEWEQKELEDPGNNGPQPTVGEWDATCLGRNVTRIHVTLVYDQKLMGGSLPDISAKVRGLKIRDPRDNQVRWTNNAALCQAHYLQLPEVGFGATDAEIDETALIADANLCDESVTVQGDTQARYTVDGVIYGDVPRRETLEALLSSSVGYAYYSAGKWRLMAAAFRPPTIELSDDDLGTGAIETTVGAPYQRLYNAVRGQFIDPDNDYALNDFPPYPAAAGPYQAQDNGEWLFEDFDFPFVQNALRAQRLAKLALFRARQSLTETATYKLSALRLQPGDTFQLTRPSDGMDQKTMIVLQRQFAPDAMNVVLSYQEDAPEAYDENYDELVNPDPTPNTNLPDPSFVNPPQNLAADSSEYEVTSDGAILPYCLITWDPITTADVLRGGHIQLHWKWGHETEWRRLKVEPLADQFRIEPIYSYRVLNIRATAVNGIGVESEPAFLNQEIGQVLPAGQIIRGGNILPNANLSTDITGWGATLNSNLGDDQEYPPIKLLRKGTFENPGNIIFDNVGEGISSGIVYSPRFFCDGQHDQIFQALVMPGQCAVQMFFAMYDPNGKRVFFVSYPSLRSVADINPANPANYRGIVSRFSSVTFRRLGPTEDQAYYGRLAFRWTRDTAAYGEGRSVMAIQQPLVAQIPTGYDPKGQLMPWQPSADFGQPNQSATFTGGPSVTLPWDAAASFTQVASLNVPDSIEGVSVLVQATIEMELTQGASTLTEAFGRIDHGAPGNVQQGKVTTLLDGSGLTSGQRRRQVVQLQSRFTNPDINASASLHLYQDAAQLVRVYQISITASITRDT